jgi:hypothetical protein
MHHIESRRHPEIGRLVWTNRQFWMQKLHFSEEITEKRERWVWNRFEGFECRGSSC